jgi:hypothetical protein
MFIIEWMFDKMGYTKKVDWTALFADWDKTLEKPKKKPAKKAVAKKTVKSRARKV